MIVCIGGGTGLFSLLSGLVNVDESVRPSAVVCMADSGGSTGRLRDEFGYLPPGDVRQCLIALSQAPLELRQLMQYRFRNGGSLKGHSLGNLILTAMKDIQDGEYEAIEALESVLRIRGKVYPVSLTDCHLVAELEDGTRIEGESNIDVPKHDPRIAISKVWLEPRANIFGETQKVIEGAREIVIGPGDLYTSIMPNLVVAGVREAIDVARSKGAKVTFIINTMTKHGETDNYKASDFLNVITGAIGDVDRVLVNLGTITGEQRARYEKEHAFPVQNDLEGPIIVARDLVSQNEFARHDPEKLARAVLER